jgi:hypothetical protein
MIEVIFADRGYAGFLIGLPIALAALSRAVPGSKGLGPDRLGFDLEAERRLAVFIVGAAFMGVAIAIREIVNESSIYRRERAIGLSPTAYLASKVVVFVVVDTIQVLILDRARPARQRPGSYHRTDHPDPRDQRDVPAGALRRAVPDRRPDRPGDRRLPRSVALGDGGRRGQHFVAGLPEADLRPCTVPNLPIGCVSWCFVSGVWLPSGTR